jgi:GT2 family glycosyltransferase
VLVLNYNGRGLLEECLPSVLAAAGASQHLCQVVVVDNASTDDSVEFLRQRFPQVTVAQQPNRGLCSFNEVLPTLGSCVAVLLNNDIKLDRTCLDPLVEPLLRQSSPLALREENISRSEMPTITGPRCFMTAPRCWLFDGSTHEGFKTAVRWRFGLVQATAKFPGHEEVVDQPGPTASAGAAIAVNRRLFLELGGFDPLYLPGRIEDLDFAFRGYLAGHQASYVPTAIAYHQGMATFGPAYSQRGCDYLALRNTLLFQWKNLRHPRHIAQQAVGLPLRLLRDALTAPFVPREARFSVWIALADAWKRRKQICAPQRRKGAAAREAQFFREFHPRALRRGATEQPGRSAAAGLLKGERLRDRRHPISRWYLLPLADWASRRLARSGVRPWQVTIAGATVAAVAGLAVCLGLGGLAAVLVLAAWFCDRLDGKLARRQKTESPWGAWLDANVDELTDLGLHAALALATAAAAQSSIPWALFTAFVVGKYLFVYGLTSDESAAGRAKQPGCFEAAGLLTTGDGPTPLPEAKRRWLRQLYHLPGNADVRAHVLALLLLSGWWTAELLLVAVYFNFRWIARYVLVARRLGNPRAPASGPLPPTPRTALSIQEAPRAA